MRYLLTILCVALLVGCESNQGPHIVSSPTPAYQGAYTRTEAEGIALVFCSRRGDAYCRVYDSKSDSMWPIFDDNVILVFEYLPERLQVGQIIAAGYSRHKSLCHTIEAIQGDYLRLKGFNNKQADAWIHRDLYQGTYIASFPFKLTEK